jgi:hypothetical protein
LSANSFGQEIVIKGKITDIDNRDIQNASVSILDENEDSFIRLQMKMASMLYGFKKSEQVKMTLVITCLGYSKTSKLITAVSQMQNFVLEKK